MTGGLDEEDGGGGKGARVQDEPGLEEGGCIWKVLGGAKLGSVVPGEG